MSSSLKGNKLERFKTIQNYINEIHKDAVKLWQLLISKNTSSSNNSLPDEKNIKTCLAAMIQFLKEGIDDGDTKLEPNQLTLVQEPGCAVIKLSPLKEFYREYEVKAPIVFLGHLDTVHSPNYWISNSPTNCIPGEITGRSFIEEVIWGPGALDMKGGLVEALLILRTIIRFKLNNRTIKFIITFQEEHGHCSIPKIYAEHNNLLYPARNMEEIFAIHVPHDTEAAFVFETCSRSNEVIVGRRGVRHCEIIFEGTGGHPGRDKIKTVSPINAAARLTRSIWRRSKDEKDACSVTVTRIEGGEADNAVPQKCRMVLDIRYDTPEDARAFDEWLKENLVRHDRHKQHAPFMLKYLNHMPASPDLRTSRALKDALCESAEYFITKFPGPAIVSGGGGDASYLTMKGIPTLDSLGVTGVGNHTLNEHADVQSLKEKAAMVMALLFDKFFYVNGMEY